VVLIGNGRNDKVSLYNDFVLSKVTKVKEFYENRKEQIKHLKMLRDKIYSHVDSDLSDLLISMPLDFIKGKV